MPSLDSLQIELRGIARLIADQQLGVPANQREYSWEKEHVDELLDDIAQALGADAREYFLGSIVASTGHQPDRPDVVDGQQRLATVTAFLAAVRDYFLSVDDGDRADDIENRYLLSRDLRSLETTPRLRLNTADDDFFRKRVLSRPESPDRLIGPSRSSHRKIVVAAECAADRVRRVVNGQNDPTLRLLDWVEYVHDRVKVIWVRVPDDTNAYVISKS